MLIKTIPARKHKDFVDPFPYTETEVLTSSTSRSVLKTKEADPKVGHSYLLGNKRITDERGGDAGSLYKAAEVVPHIFFIRASLIAPYNSIMSHPELKSQGKSLKQFYVTASIGVAYENDFCTEIFNIQRPAKENIHTDHSLDYFSKVI